MCAVMDHSEWCSWQVGSLHFNRGHLIHQTLFLMLSLLLSVSFINRPTLAHPLWIGRAIWTCCLVTKNSFWNYCCSQNWDERQGSNAHKQTHRSRWRTNWEFFPYRHSWQTLSWYYLKSIRTIACSKCVAATLKTWGIVLHTGEAERGSNCQPDGKANYSLNNYCHYTFVIVNLS